MAVKAAPRFAYRVGPMVPAVAVTETAVPFGASVLLRLKKLEAADARGAGAKAGALICARFCAAIASSAADKSLAALAETDSALAGPDFDGCDHIVVESVNEQKIARAIPILWLTNIVLIGF